MRKKIDKAIEKLAVWIYRLMEILDGKKGLQLISYRYAERIKIDLLTFIR